MYFCLQKFSKRKIGLEVVGNITTFAGMEPKDGTANSPTWQGRKLV